MVSLWNPGWYAIHCVAQASLKLVGVLPAWVCQMLRFRCEAPGPAVVIASYFMSAFMASRSAGWCTGSSLPSILWLKQWPIRPLHGKFHRSEGLGRSQVLTPLLLFTMRNTSSNLITQHLFLPLSSPWQQCFLWSPPSWRQLTVLIPAHLPLPPAS